MERLHSGGVDTIPDRFEHWMTICEFSPLADITINSSIPVQTKHYVRVAKNHDSSRESTCNVYEESDTTFYLFLG